MLDDKFDFGYILGGCHITNINFEQFFEPRKVVKNKLWMEMEEYLGQVKTFKPALTYCAFVLHLGSTALGGCVSFVMHWGDTDNTAIHYGGDGYKASSDFPDTLELFKPWLASYVSTEPV